MKVQRRSRAVAWATAATLFVAGCSTAAPTVDAVDASPAPSTSSVAPTGSPPVDAEAPTESVQQQALAPTSAGDDKASSRAPGTAVAGGARGTEQTGVTQAPSGSAAAADGSEVLVYDAPGGEAVRTFANPTATGTPLTFMVTSTTDEWVQVQLPVRPNGSTGWLRAQDVTMFDVAYALKVSTADNTLKVYRDGDLIHTFSVATGTGATPTPLGTYYLTELIAPTNRGYGPYAYGVSAFSEVLNEFGGGPGQIGLHGTDDRGSIGQAASHGCIRLSNEDITTLAALLPLGTPIEIT